MRIDLTKGGRCARLQLPFHYYQIMIDMFNNMYRRYTEVDRDAE